VRCLIPFTYFFFYQYGVISRPYCMMMVAIMLSAITYGARNEKPVRFILSLAFLCATSAFGIFLAGGLCMVWTVEIFMEYRKTHTWKQVLSDRRAYALFGLLLFAIFLGCCLVTPSDCFYNGEVLTLKEKFGRLFYALLLPFDSLFGNFINVEGGLQTKGGLVAACVGGILTWAVLLLFLHSNQKKATFLVPYSIYLLFCVFVQFSVHHIGISTLFILFTFWIMLAGKNGLQIPKFLSQLSAKITSPLIRRVIGGVGILVAAVPLLYTGVSSTYDVLYQYGFASELASFLKDNQLDDKKIMVCYTLKFKDEDENEEKQYLNYIVNDETLPAELPEIEVQYPYLSGVPGSTLPYFDHNIFMNFNTDEPDKMYVQWLNTTDTESIFEEWREQGLPDVVIGLVPLNEIYGKEALEGVTYRWVATFHYGNIWRLTNEDNEVHLYIREDLLDEYPQLEVLTY
jgi:hypothetical protein